MFNNSMAGTLPKKIIQPTHLAIAVSVLIHGAFLYFGIPYNNAEIPEENDDPDLTRNVPVIELTPEEKSRLPDLSPQLPEIPAFNQPPDLSSIQGLPPLPPLPPIASSFSSLQPIFTPLPPNASIPLPPPPPPLSFPSSANITLPPPPPLSKLPTSKNLPAPPPPLNGDIKPASNLPPSFSSPIPGNTQPVEPIQQTQIQQYREQIIAKRQQNLLASIDRLGKNLQKDDRNTSPEEGNKNYLNWLARIKAAKPTMTNLIGTYPKDACLRKLEGITTYGIMVDTSGKAVETELIRSAGYPILNKQALRDIKSSTYINQTGQLQPYQVNVNFKHDDRVCPSLGLSRSNKLQPSQGVNNLPSRSPIPAPINQNSGNNLSPKPQVDRPSSPSIPTPVNQNSGNNLTPKPQVDRTQSSPIPSSQVPSANPQLNNTRLQTTPLDIQKMSDRQKLIEQQRAIEAPLVNP